MKIKFALLTLALCCAPFSLFAQLGPDGQIGSVEERRILVSIEQEYDKLAEKEAEIDAREMEAWLRDERLDAVQHTVSKWNKAKEAKP